MIEVSDLRKEFILSKQQRKELNTKDTKAVAVDGVSFTCQPYDKVLVCLRSNLN